MHVFISASSAASYMLASLQEIDIENVGNNDEVEDIVVDSLQEEQVCEEKF